MNREDQLVIRLSTAERMAINRLAQVERLPASTLARRMLLHEVDRCGLWPPSGPQNGGEASNTPSRPETTR